MSLAIILEPERERAATHDLAARELGGGWARRARAEKKVDKQEKLYIMGYYEN